MTAPPRLLSIVIPVLDEEENVPRVAARVQEVLATLPYEHELIFVDDGSRDGTLEAIARLHEADPRIKAIAFSRNFGHQFALTAGLDHARGDAVISLDGDLQHPPELLPQLIRHWEEGYDIVYTQRESTVGASAFKRWTSKLYYRAFLRLTGIDLPPEAADFRLLDRKVVLALGHVRERTRFLRGLTSWIGFKSLGIPYQAAARTAGRSKYTLRRMGALAVDGILSFSTIPLTIGIYCGAGLASAGMLYTIYIFYVFLFTDWVIAGWTSMILMTLWFGGLQLVLLGIIGLYLSKIFEEVKHRPLYLVRSTLGVQTGPAGPPELP